jgi:long-chain fatty acid transport protein
MKTIFLLFACCLFAFTSDVFALTDEEIFRNFQFSFVNPGARSGAMGGAFIGLADDATAAEANPAGLVILTKPEVSFEYRNTEFDAARLNDFSSVQEEGLGLSVLSQNTLEELNQPSFMSVVYPFRVGTVAFSRQELSRTEGGIDETFLLTGGGEDLLFATIASQDQKIVNYNFSFGSKLTDRFSVGATARISKLDWVASVQNILFLGNLTFPLFQTAIDDSDTAFGWNVGGLFTANSHVSVGAVYKKNPRFEVTEVESGPASNEPGPFVNVLNVPDTLGVGVAVKPNDKITVVADIVRVENSDLAEDIAIGRNVLTSGFTGNDIIYTIDDAWDFHVGTEFVIFLGSIPVALREGYYRRSSSSLVVESSPGVGGSDETLNALFKAREDEHHFTIGNGFVFGSHFQIDWAIDLANLQDSFILSTVVRF